MEASLTHTVPNWLIVTGILAIISAFGVVGLMLLAWRSKEDSELASLNEQADIWKRLIARRKARHQRYSHYQAKLCQVNAAILRRERQLG
jgi:hypothetical protein